jgi:hypothetical protein
MRYYRITIKKRDGSLFRPAGLGVDLAGASFSSYIPAFGGQLGRSDPGALDVELDLPIGPFCLPMGGAFCRVWGVGLKDIGQASDLTADRA